MSHRTQFSLSGIARALLVITLPFALAVPSLAGRPLAVDDANVNAVGSGHVEVWYERQPGNTDVGTVAPAFGVAEGLEIGAAFARDSTNGVSTNLVQAKFRWTASQDDGCNVGTTFGIQNTPGSGTNTPFVVGLFTCNSTWGSVHVNLGTQHPSDGPSAGTWGIAFEHAFEAFTAHVETFGQEQTSPKLQLGLRKDIAKNIQLDATVGRADNDTVLSLGMKFMF